MQKLFAVKCTKGKEMVASIKISVHCLTVIDHILNLKMCCAIERLNILVFVDRKHSSRMIGLFRFDFGIIIYAQIIIIVAKSITNKFNSTTQSMQLFSRPNSINAIILPMTHEHSVMIVHNLYRTQSTV